MATLTVSVLLVSYNQGPLLDRAVRSVLGQTYQDWELGVLDDGSTDETTLALLDEYSDWDAEPAIPFHLFRFHPSLEERAATVRYATLLNWGAVRAEGKYLTFLSGDDYYLPDRLERMVAKIQQAGSVVYGPQLMLDESGQSLGIRRAAGVLRDARCKVDLNSVLMTRKAFEHVGGFPDRPATPLLWRQADTGLWGRLTDAGYWFVPVDGPEPTDCKTFRIQGVDARVLRGETPWVAV